MSCHESPGQTLQATALVHEAYLRLVGDEPPSWNSRAHFFAAAAEAMRRILVDHARQKRSVKRGGNHNRVDCEALTSLPEEPNVAPEDLIALDDTLARLAGEDAMLAELVKLHCFAGLPLVQVAELLGISPRTAERHWAFARAWFQEEIHGKTSP